MLWLVLDPVNKTHLLVLIHCITLGETDQTCREIHHEISVCDNIQIHSTGSLWCPCIETVRTSHVLIHLSTPLSNISLGHLEEARHYEESSSGDIYPLVIYIHLWETMFFSLVHEKYMGPEAEWCLHDVSSRDRVSNWPPDSGVPLAMEFRKFSLFVTGVDHLSASSPALCIVRGRIKPRAGF